ncbi:MAG: DNA polymerase IV [Nitrosopumilus sp.]|nr:DNA polymerase IV [Nitrosopumilus sp.]MDA7940754.1 DNA polymerase IV [Nitrosopumilus sp.]MDA7942962.1 DNA polymerase IV [Nitrosopumilus sp.]MDA7944627.1 DNA polymerase IV [Nitrosopumilus sp.]MDA7952210.1 DNA polymerase IV [Nitrosopumilus sp.]
MHVDFDYFYAQCEEIRRPELRTRPVCVCVYSGRGGDSGAVATANYAAREYGAKSGMPITLAKRSLAGRDDAEFLRVDFGHYEEVSAAAMSIIRGFADTFEYVGRDEAYLDVTGRTGADFGRASHLAQQLKNALRSRMQLSCSVGVSPNRLLSKIASDYKKPDGLTVVRPREVEKFLGPLPIRDVPGIGGRTEERLASEGVATMEDLRRLDIFRLQQMFGRKTGTYLHNAAKGEDETPVSESSSRAQYSRLSTLSRDSTDIGFLRPHLAEMCRDVHGSAVADSVMFRSVGIHIIQSDLSARTRSRMLRAPTQSLTELERCAEALLEEALETQESGIRRLGVRVADLSEMAGQSDITSYF